ncbi:MAG TPA: polysaccharide biosynthesis/export family protein [Phenylobacterium sp.]|uniref:polysaccharide biosynthesis/export family protein n=1 Tax=Phenylobacterium sp. TaxID=1871053 RepID=UPI002BFD5080|nr:polysaccharide biosynthesis/export family protein [Phenylobacterium sp.]HSV04625.1 polysaccharide biosynthesis/export family protein [Phenylobacterium sp.]
MRRRLFSLAAATLLAFSATPVFATSALLPPPDNVSRVTPGATEYRIGPQDTLEINVNQLPELSHTVQVDLGGKILLPLIGQINALGRTPPELSNDIAAALRKSYMKDPQVTVAVKEAQGQKVTVEGAVASPGVYALAGPTSLMQAVALAKGVDSRLANEHRVAIFRTVGGVRRSAFYDLAQIRTGKAEDPSIYGNDIVVVDQSGAKSFMQNFQGGSFLGLLGMLIRPW